MKYKRKTSKVITQNFMMELLADRGIDTSDKDFMDKYFRPTIENENDPLLLDNVIEGAELLERHIKNHGQIYIVVDSDVDGFTSAAVVYNILKDEYKDYDVKINYHVPDGKEHGLETLMDIFTKEKICDLIILPDSSSNDYEEHRILKEMGYDILILDHHNAPKYSENAIVINNQLSEDYPNKHLSGVGVVYKFFEYFEKHMPTGRDYAIDYIDLVAFGEISDMMNMGTLENRFICEYGLTHIKNNFFKLMVDSQAFSLKDNMCQDGIAWSVTPMVNALIRIGSDIEKERLFESFINPNKIVPSTKRGAKKDDVETVAAQTIRNCTNAKRHQKDMMTKAMQLLDVQIFNNNLDSNKVIILSADGLDIPNTLTGYCAMTVSAAYKKPVMLGRETKDGYFRGSIRGQEESELKDFQTFLLDSGMMEYVDGHANAAGFGLKKKFIDSLTNYSNEKLKDIDFNENYYEADFVVTGNCTYLSPLILDIASANTIWGQGNKKPIVISTDITIDVNDISICGSNNDTFRFTFNNITYIKFKASDLIEQIKPYKEKGGKINITVAGECKINRWQNQELPQIGIKEIEIKECSVSDF